MNMELANGVVQLGKARGLMVATAESCTGGLIAATLTDMPGSSAVVDRGFVTYSNEAKSELLGVSMATIQAQGAVSEIVARDMVSGALAASRADVAVAVTGIAGPDGGTVEKPVGLVFIAVQSRDGSPKVREYRFATSHDAHSRVEIRLATVEAALVMMRDEMGQV